MNLDYIEQNHKIARTNDNYTDMKEIRRFWIKVIDNIRFMQLVNNKTRYDISSKNLFKENVEFLEIIKELKIQ